MPGEAHPKPIRWVGSSKEDLSGFPNDVKRRMGLALFEAQMGGKASYAKPLKGYRGAGVLEVVDDFGGDTFRVVYTVRFTGAVYALHAFKKKSRRGIATPQSEIELIGTRLRRATEDYTEWHESERRQPR
jgi:phage-related protein